MTDDERVAEIMAREAKATPGPWNRDKEWSRVDNKYMQIVELRSGGIDGESNADFIAHARSDIPYLLSRLQQARAVISAARKTRRNEMNSVEHHDGWWELRVALDAYDKGGEGE